MMTLTITVSILRDFANIVIVDVTNIVTDIARKVTDIARKTSSEKHRYKKHLPTSITTQMTTQTTWQPLDSSFIMMNAIE